MNELQASLTIALANVFVTSFKAQSHHWHIEGPFFYSLHDLFGDVYETLNCATDNIAERIRILGGTVPYSIANLVKYSTVHEDQGVAHNPQELLPSLISSCKETSVSLNKALDIATRENQQGVIDYLAGLIDSLDKHIWMLVSTAKQM